MILRQTLSYTLSDLTYKFTELICKEFGLLLLRPGNSNR